MAKIIIIRGTQQSGKTTTAGLVYRELLQYCNKEHKFNGSTVNTDSLIIKNDTVIDFKAELTCNNKKIGILSAGDIANDVRDNLNIFINIKIDVIICCARSVNRIGSTYRMIMDDFSKKNEIALEIFTEYSNVKSEKFTIKNGIVNTILKKILEITSK
ncbi:MAG: hypothetical protein HY951_06405 [Bacteroidia bacterium]|nr:hypothetical protein [Bacteroidia bacterium]